MLALPDNLTPWPIGQYPKNPPPRIRPAPLECYVEFGGAGFDVRYHINRRSEVFIESLQINGAWVDPVTFGFSDANLRVIENEVREVEAEVRECE